MDAVLADITKIFHLIPFSASTWFLLCIITFFIILFIRANHDPRSPVDWQDLFLDVNTKKANPYKLGYLIGLIVATWIVVTITDAGKLTIDIFGGYLAFLLGGAGWGLKNSSNAGITTDSPIPPPPTQDTTTTTTTTTGTVFTPPPPEKN